MNLYTGAMPASQANLFAAPEADSPAAQFNADFAKRALDELFLSTRQYATGAALGGLFDFMRRFRTYSPYNAFLLHVQSPGAVFVAPASRWRRLYSRTIKPGARPLVILQPMGPVMFVFDVSDTEPADADSPPLPREITDPFEPGGSLDVMKEFAYLRHNAIRDGILVADAAQGAQAAGYITTTRTRGALIDFSKDVAVQRRYDLVLNSSHSRPAQFTTLVHELAHLYCGHLGIPFPTCKWWPDRTGLSREAEEFEAESVAYLVCCRLGVNPPSAQYLSGYLGQDRATPPISLDRVLVAAGLIEDMTQRSLPPTRPPKREAP